MYRIGIPRSGYFILTLMALLALGSATWAASPESPAVDPKLRVLVDKVLMKHTGWVMTADQVREIAAAGFNVVSPRRGNDDPDEVRRISRLAGEQGIRHLPWMRATLRTDSTDTRQDVRLTWANGAVQDLYSPNSDELWHSVEARVLGYARISVEEPALMGVFLDFENYAPGSQGRAYQLSYDGVIWQRFAAARRLSLPSLAPAQRQPWLEIQGLHEAFSAFQLEAWRDRCRHLRAAVDAINPRFQFCVYPGPGTLFIRAAVWSEWSTDAAPLILADGVTYGRPQGIYPHENALQRNAERLEHRQQRARDGVPSLIYMGGIDPVSPGADPEFSGKNAVRIAAASDGYWVFYQGPTYGEADHQAYWQWFTWANQAIASGDLQAYAAPRQTRDVMSNETLVRETGKLQLGLYGLKPRIVDLVRTTGCFEVHELSGISEAYLKQLDVVVLQNFNVELDSGHPWVRSLRNYVRQGGGLMLAHDSAWFMDSPVPEIATRGYPVSRVEAIRHVVDKRLQTLIPHAALGRVEESVAFETEFRDHMIFTPGDSGTVIVRNHFGDAVYVVGEFGSGRMVFAGSYYGYDQPLAEPERSILLACLRWLAQ